MAYDDNIYGVSFKRPGHWSDYAACLKEDPELFQPEGNSGFAAEKIKRARQICVKCPVILECLREAIEEDITVGIWGGLTEADRENARLKRLVRERKLGEEVLRETVRGKIVRPKSGILIP